MTGTGALQTIAAGTTFTFSSHARRRMGARGVSHDAVEAVLSFGRKVHTRGAKIFVVGRREIARYRQHCPSLDHLDGIHVVCTSDNLVLTVYRNRDFGQLKPRRRRR